MNRNNGFDYLRVLALGLVYLQHQFSVLEKLNWVEAFDLNLGQLGVAIFLAISGFLAAQSKREPVAWARARFKRVYPAYWAAILLSFAAAMFSGYKTFSLWQFFSQMAGTGLLTHRDTLINVASWFISLLIILYTQVFAARFLGKPYLYMTGVAIVGGAMLGSGVFPLIGAHVFIFCLGYLYNNPKNTWGKWPFYLVVALLICLCPWFRNSAYCAMAFILLLLSGYIHRPSRIISIISGLSYYFFLIHGIFLVGAQQLFGHMGWLLSIPAGVLGSVVAAYLMQWFFEKSYFAKRMGLAA